MPPPKKTNIMKKTIYAMTLIAAIMLGGAATYASDMSWNQSTKTTKTQSKSSQNQYSWIYGTWECSGTIDMGPYLGGRQRFTSRAIITKTNLKVYYDGDLVYNGSYKIERGEIKYNQTSGTCDVLPLDSANKRIEFGQGYYYHKVS